MEFGILGPLSVRTGDRQLVLGSGQQRTVLAVLLLRAGEPVPAARLIDVLWGERPPASAAKALQVRVSELRRALGDGVIETHALGYLLQVEDGALDAVRFERYVERGRRLLAEGDPGQADVVLREGLALWRGPALADFLYDDFARAEAARLEQLRVVAVETRIEAALALGRHAEAVPELEALVLAHPLRERFRELLMLALYRAGRQAEALAVYHDTRAVLSDELGLEPGPALQRLERAILVQDASLDVAGAPHAPAAPARTPARGAPAATNSERIAESRKTVTVLFCDVVAYTELAGRLDPEALRHVMSRFFELTAGAVERHGGTVEKFVGDEVIAVFGVPNVREDDALRALRAALEMRALVPRLEIERSTRLEVRIGVNTGEVVAGDPASGHDFVSGEAVTVGKRLEQSAGAGEILLGHETYRLVAHAVETTELGPLQLKNKAEPVAAYRLDGLVEGARALPHRDDVPLVGRERELERLRDTFREATAEGARQVTIVGEPGIGKSRLVREFTAGLEGTATVLVGRCPPYGEGITFWPLREVLAQAGRDPGALAGSSHEVFASARRLLEELAAERPLVVVFDDVHWAEPTFLDFVEYLAGRLGSAPVLVVCLTRPQLLELRPGWTHPPAVVVLPEPLTGEESERLLAALGTPTAVRRRIAEVAEGNPLFVEQLAASADEEGAVAGVPGSIRGVLHERLDRLEHEERALLERAAVAGRSFSLEAVLDLTPADERDTAHSRLLALQRKRFVRPDPTSPEEGFRFHHALIRDAAYDGVPKSTRSDLHIRVARRLEERSTDPAVVGYHLEQAALYRRELARKDVVLERRAAALLVRAAQIEFGHADLPATVGLFERARTLLPTDEANRLAPELGEALFEAGRLTEAEQVLSPVAEAAELDPLLAARARVELQFVRLHAEPATEGARAVAAASLAVAEGSGDELGQCRASCLRAWIDWTEGYATAADEAWQRAARHAETAGGERELFKILGWRASALAEGPMPVPEAIEACRSIRERVASSPLAVAVALRPLAYLHAMRGELDDARALIGESHALADEVGRMQSAAAHHQALVETLAGDHAAAERCLVAGYEQLEAMGEKALLATTAAMIAQSVYAQGRYEEAERYCEAAEGAAAADDLVTHVTLRNVRGKILARRGESEAAELLSRDAVRLISRTDMLTTHGDTLLDLAEVLRLGGRTADADAAVEDAIVLYKQKGNTVSAGCAGARRTRTARA